MMNHPVTERRGLDAPFFGIVDDKFAVTAVAVGLPLQLFFQFQQIFFGVELKRQNFAVIFFALPCGAVRLKKIAKIRYPIKQIVKCLHTFRYA